MSPAEWQALCDSDPTVTAKYWEKHTQVRGCFGQDSKLECSSSPTAVYPIQVTPYTHSEELALGGRMQLVKSGMSWLPDMIEARVSRPCFTELGILPDLRAALTSQPLSLPPFLDKVRSWRSRQK